TEFFIPGAERAGGEVLPADLAELQSRCPDRPFQIGNLEVDHLMASRLEAPSKSGERIVVARRRETQDADPTSGSSLPAFGPLHSGRLAFPDNLGFVHARLSFLSIVRSGCAYAWRRHLARRVPARPRPPSLLLRNGKGLAQGLLGGTCGPLGDSCGRPELS